MPPAGPAFLSDLIGSADKAAEDDELFAPARVVAWDGRRAAAVSRPGNYRVATPAGRGADVEIADLPAP